MLKLSGLHLSKLRFWERMVTRAMQDRYGREIDYMRISITEHCNLHCNYCMPQTQTEQNAPLQSDFLTYPEILQVVQAAATLGITHYRITGGEPLVRTDCAGLIREIKTLPGVSDVGLTTNGVLLAAQAADLARAGLDGVNVSLDTLDAAEFEQLTGRDALSEVLSGIDAAKEAGIPVKLNVVNRKGLNYLPILEYGRQKKLPVRFIEMMPIGCGKSYMGSSNEQLLAAIREQYGEPEKRTPKDGAAFFYGNGPAEYYDFPEADMQVGFISAMNHKFCDRCSRVRLTARGDLKLCLCYETGVNLREAIRQPDEGRTLAEVMRQAILEKPAEHCFFDTARMTEEKNMVCIGG